MKPKTSPYIVCLRSEEPIHRGQWQQRMLQFQQWTRHLTRDSHAKGLAFTISSIRVASFDFAVWHFSHLFTSSLDFRTGLCVIYSQRVDSPFQPRQIQSQIAQDQTQHKKTLQGHHSHTMPQRQGSPCNSE